MKFRSNRFLPALGSVILLLTGCTAPDPTPSAAVSASLFLGGYVGIVAVERGTGSQITQQTYAGVSVLITQRSHPDSVSVLLYQRDLTLPSPLAGYPAPNRLRLRPSTPKLDKTALQGEATRRADSLFMTVSQRDGAEERTYRIKAALLQP
ncbi:hypothetical protein [Spirosoma montaniterrae]|nr:hypothetical protein [Spirosoma montaniterrae]